MNISDLQKQAHAIAKEKGWWDKPRSIGELIALCHSELSKALEEARYDYPLNDIYDESPSKPAGFPIELADLIIRVADMAEGYNIDLDTAIKLKMEYNKTRPYRHGGKKL